ncbi:hypothetical protein F5Y12DRAFT_709872 [Xylaria sp. FL1777]|nr:hypothetical protein F5Y12DRAFT_709872 [Xylaria sp. FL1777]
MARAAAFVLIKSAIYDADCVPYILLIYHLVIVSFFALHLMPANITIAVISVEKFASLTYIILRLIPPLTVSKIWPNYCNTAAEKHCLLIGDKGYKLRRLGSELA